MMRNSVIIGLSRALVVVEAGEKGGTLAAGTKALELNRQVIALEFSKMPPGMRPFCSEGRSRLVIVPNSSRASSN